MLRQSGDQVLQAPMLPQLGHQVLLALMLGQALQAPVLRPLQKHGSVAPVGASKLKFYSMHFTGVETRLLLRLCMTVWLELLRPMSGRQIEDANECNRTGEEKTVLHNTRVWAWSIHARLAEVQLVVETIPNRKALYHGLWARLPRSQAKSTSDRSCQSAAMPMPTPINARRSQADDHPMMFGNIPVPGITPQVREGLASFQAFLK